MAQRGRKPKPTQVKILEGNPGKRPLDMNEPKPQLKAPKCPTWLDPEAKKEWRRVAKQLEQLGILTELDMTALAGYCQAYARWKNAEEVISKHGFVAKSPSGYLMQLPHVSISQNYLKTMLKFCVEFGMTPSSRARFGNEKAEQEEDPMELILLKSGGNNVR